MQPAACNERPQFTQYARSGVLHFGERAFIKCRFQAGATAQTGQRGLTGLPGVRRCQLSRVSTHLTLCSVRLRGPHQLYPVFRSQVSCKWRHQATMLDNQAFFTCPGKIDNIIARYNGSNGNCICLFWLTGTQCILAIGAGNGAIFGEPAAPDFLHNWLDIGFCHEFTLSNFAGKIPARSKRSPVACRSSSRSTMRAKTLTWPKGWVSP